ncbi:MAM and LDL-receptor class a domain-containing protein 1-like [Plakobranchus ocellatus]|uniref:MAM and LDL-receptor class a domain-containing protein 1-like n=1 Tax=Plakobranchus ocellatus TaxID=259542 RepID=A0AAV4C0N7_9GAST|nr:MAM and LDL-receptor class a domain-containing protein 1-like [Plakobranchus ocellatus]
MCGYTSHTFNTDRAGETESRWLRLTSSYGISYFGPPSDHTQKHRNGGFAFSDQFLQEFSSTERTALLKSPVLRNTPVACVSFWYYFTGQAKGILRMRAHMGLFEGRATFDGWRYSGPIQISSRKPYQIEFESVRLTSSGASMAVDDVLVTEGQCSKHPIPASASDEKPTAAPIPALIPHIPVPDKPDHNDRRKLNCYAYCENWKTCYILEKHSVKCVCQDEYIGNQCEIPRPPKKQNGHQQSFKDEKPQATKQSESDGWKTAVAIVFSLALVAVLTIIVFILLVRTNRLHAPTLLQRLFPSLLSSSASQGGIENPVYSYSNSQNLEDAVVNPVYNSSQ